MVNFEGYVKHSSYLGVEIPRLRHSSLRQQTGCDSGMFHDELIGVEDRTNLIQKHQCRVLFKNILFCMMNKWFQSMMIYSK